MKQKKMILMMLLLIIVLGLLCGCSEKSKDKEPADTRPKVSEAPKKDKKQEASVDEDVQAEPTPAGEEAELIAAALDPAATEPERNIKAFQDIASFFGKRFDDWTETYRRIALTEINDTAVLDYINLLIDEFGYEIVDTYQFEYGADDPFGGHFPDGSWEVCLGLAAIDTGRETRGQHVNADCDISLSANKGKLKLLFTDLFHTEDYGFRWSGHEGDRFNEVFGQRALDAYYKKDGRYYNGSDGVLSVEAGTHGEAVILVNGDALLYSTEAGVHKEIYADYPCDDYEIEVYEFLEETTKEMFEVTVPMNLTGGELYTMSDALGRLGASPIWVKMCRLGENGGVSSTTEPTGRSALNACTVRVLKWDKEECVVYMAMDIVYELEPMTIEILAAMPPYGSLWGDSFKQEEAITLKVGESLELKYDGPYVFMPNYETYEWKISSGQGAAVSGYSDTCTVTGAAPGEVVIKCVYSYGKDEADVLTGIARNENHTKTKLYYIRVVE